MTRTEFERSVRQLRPEMLKVARSFFASPDDAEDAVQDALVRLWQYAERIDTRQNVAGLAVRVTKNCCVNLWRSRQKTDNQLATTSSASSPTATCGFRVTGRG